MCFGHLDVTQQWCFWGLKTQLLKKKGKVFESDAIIVTMFFMKMLICENGNVMCMHIMCLHSICV